MHAYIFERTMSAQKHTHASNPLVDRCTRAMRKQKEREQEGHDGFKKPRGWGTRPKGYQIIYLDPSHTRETELSVKTNCRVRLHGGT